MTTIKSSNFEDMWSFNCPHLSMENCQKKLHQVEVLVKKREFWIFKDEEWEYCNYALETSLLCIWEYMKAKQEERFFFTLPRNNRN